jgi:hypothetical protein
VDGRQSAADQVFILRFWRDAADCGQDSSWRAQVRHINSRAVQTAAGIDGAFGLVAAQLKAATSIAPGCDAAAMPAEQKP